MNNSLEFNLHIVLRLMNANSSRNSDTGCLKRVHNLDLADPHINIPGEIDVLLDADILEDLIFDNKIKENGLILRKKFFGWVVSGLVVEKTKILVVGYPSMMDSKNRKKIHPQVLGRCSIERKINFKPLTPKIVPATFSRNIQEKLRKLIHS